MDSPTAEGAKDCENTREEACTDVEPQYERRAPLDSVSLVIRGSMEFGELSLMDNLSGSICHFYALPPRPLGKHSSDKKPGSLNGEGPLEEHLLSVRKPAVGRTHSLPNDSYMFPPLDQSAASNSTQLHPLTHRPQHIGASHRGQSGSSSSVRSQPEESQQLTVPSELFRPISPHSASDSEAIPRLPPPRRHHTLSRPLRRQVAVSTDSQEALCADTEPVEASEGLLNVASLSYCPVVQQPVSTACVKHTEQHTMDPPSSVGQDRVDRVDQESLVDQEVSLLTCSTDYPERQNRALKRFHSVDTRGRGRLLPRPRPLSWLDEPRRHSVEVCSSVESSPQRSHASTSSGFVSRGDSLQTSTQLPSPRRKKKMSPPCISVDPPDFSLSGAPLLPGQDTCLRRRAPSSDSKDSFDLTVGEGSGPDRGSPKTTNPKLLTLPSFSFDKSSSEH